MRPVADPAANGATSGLAMPARRYGLDVLRGIAALAVVFWHWQHFFIGGQQLRRWEIAEQPWYEPFSFLYRHGWLAVEAFFVLSGFVFYWLYAEALAVRRVRFREFFVARFSRLYPLHFLTLTLVAAGQWIYFSIGGSGFVYPANDFYHFVIHLLFVPAWGFEQNASFNMPVWSVSVEVFLYAVLFLCCRLVPVRLVVLLALSAFGLFVLLRFNQPLGRGVGAFFLGGAVYLLCRRLALLGDISYASYLLHFPLQLAIVIAVTAAGLPRDVFYAEGVLVAYLAGLILLSWLSFKYFERPAQAYLRRRFLSTRRE